MNANLKPELTWMMADLVAAKRRKRSGCGRVGAAPEIRDVNLESIGGWMVCPEEVGDAFQCWECLGSDGPEGLDRVNYCGALGGKGYVLELWDGLRGGCPKSSEDFPGGLGFSNAVESSCPVLWVLGPQEPREVGGHNEEEALLEGGGVARGNPFERIRDGVGTEVTDRIAVLHSCWAPVHWYFQYGPLAQCVASIGGLTGELEVCVGNEGDGCGKRHNDKDSRYWICHVSMMEVCHV